MKPFRLAPVLFFLLGAHEVHAHAIILRSSPSPEQRIAGEEITIEVRFNSRIDAERSSLKLFKSDGSVVSLPLLDFAPDALKAKARGLAPGAYRLHWQTLSPDGHITQGDIPFVMSR
ncbi:MAG: copper resistance protein [Methylocystis sp.]|nr:MAG: copper resistance protein [Methylocystis sp.]